MLFFAHRRLQKLLTSRKNVVLPQPNEGSTAKYQTAGEHGAPESPVVELASAPSSGAAAIAGNEPPRALPSVAIHDVDA